MKSLYAAIGSLLFAAPLCAQPAQVILIRHAEKPPTGNMLNTKGRERAAALVPYLLETDDLTKFGKPVAIYAQQPNRVNGKTSSSN